jgi:aminoglycoside 6-adenylyltransferase
VNTIRSRDVRLLLLALGRTRLLVPPSKRREARAGARALATVFRPGYRVILDKDGVLERMAELVLRQPPPPHHEGRLEEIAADFWYHAVWTAKKLRRGEMWMAKTCLDGYLKDRVLDAVFLGRERPGGMEPKRLVDETLDPETVSLLSKSYAGYDRPSIERALAATLDLFAHVERQTAERLGVTLDESVEEFARAEVARVLAG